MIETGDTDQRQFIPQDLERQLQLHIHRAGGRQFNDLDFTGTSALTLNGGTIKASTGAANNTNPRLVTPGSTNSLADNSAIVIDTTRKTSLRHHRTHHRHHYIYIIPNVGIHPTSFHPLKLFEILGVRRPFSGGSLSNWMRVPEPFTVPTSFPVGTA